MKNHVVLLLVVALVFDLVVANIAIELPVADKESLLSENNDSSTNHEETLSNNSQTEQKEIETNENGETITLSPNEETLQIGIEEHTETPIDQFDFQGAIDNDQQEFYINEFNIKEPADTSLEEEFELVKESDYYYNDLIHKDPNEIMQTAAGFVPIPIIRKKKKQTRRQYANRRYNRRPYANRRHYYYYYPYYRYYRPSSLRYYY